MAQRYVPGSDILLLPRLGHYMNDAFEVMSHAEDSFRSNGIRQLSDVMLILAAQSTVFSTDEIMWFFHGNLRTAEYAIRSLMGDKKKKLPALLQRGSFGFKQGQARNYYYLTGAGLNRASKLLNGHYFNDRARGIARTKIVHTYGTGANIYQAFFAGFPFRTKREAPPKGQKYSDSDKLYTDVLIYACPEEPAKTVKFYVEEDTGSETRSVLIDKLRKYSHAGCMTKKDVLLFSFFVPRIGSYPYRESKDKGLGAAIFSQKDLSLLLSGMEKTGCDDAFEFYTDIASEKSSLVEDFLLSVHAAEREGRELKRGPMAVTENFIEAYLMASKSYQNPYVISGINRVHQTMADENLRLFAESFALLSKSGEPFLRDILTGAQVYCVATTLSCDAMRFAMLLQDDKLKQIVSDTLGKGFSYQEDMISVGSGRRAEVLRNIFRNTSDGASADKDAGEWLGQQAAFEPLCFDAGAWYRLWSIIRKGNPLPCPVICMFDDLSQAEDFFRYLGYYTYKKEQPLLGLLYRDLGRSGRLFYPVYDGNGYEFFCCEE